MHPSFCASQQQLLQVRHKQASMGAAVSSSSLASSSVGQQQRRRRKIGVVVSAAAAAAAAGAGGGKTVRFAKYQGLGNDFILIDNRHDEQPIITPEQAAKLCDRNFGVGGDGVIFALPPKAPQANDAATAAALRSGDSSYAMRIYNSDGSEPEMCGNGIRCLARFVADVDRSSTSSASNSSSSPSTAVATGAGIIRPALLDDGTVKVDMGPPTLTPSLVPTTLAATTSGKGLDAVVAAPLKVAGREWQVTCVSMGNPHAIIFASREEGKTNDDDFRPIADVDADVDLAAVGPLFESNAVFPSRTNTEFVEVLDRSHVKMRVWERGAGATLACGTGACATVVAGVLEGRLDRRCRVDLPGGPLFIEWAEEEGKDGGGVGGTVFMTGPAVRVFEGEATV